MWNLICGHWILTYLIYNNLPLKDYYTRIRIILHVNAEEQLLEIYTDSSVALCSNSNPCITASTGTYLMPLMGTHVSKHVGQKVNIPVAQHVS